MSAVVFVTRQNCSLCHHALPWVERAASKRGHDLEVVDVDAANLASEYGIRVPVVLRDGVVVLEGRFSAADTRRALR